MPQCARDLVLRLGLCCLLPTALPDLLALHPGAGHPLELGDRADGCDFPRGHLQLVIRGFLPMGVVNLQCSWTRRLQQLCRIRKRLGGRCVAEDCAWAQGALRGCHRDGCGSPKLHADEPEGAIRCCHPEQLGLPQPPLAEHGLEGGSLPLRSSALAAGAILAHWQPRGHSSAKAAPTRPDAGCPEAELGQQQPKSRKGAPARQALGRPPGRIARANTEPPK
mmetsp:Transcript_144617/g.360473  ORF Transcript_144617/g.360473 Transcript_144617/m.360473 type:complete len:222 (+) Transcript_144617:239-904(+)